MKYPIRYITIVLLTTGFHSTGGLTSTSFSIKQAEELAVMQDPDVAAQKKSIELSTLGREKHLWSLSPSLSARGVYSRQGETTTETKTLTLSQSIPFPPHWSLEEKIRDLQQRIATMEVEQRISEVLREIRTAYFHLKKLENRYRNSQRNRTIALSIKTSAFKRYQSGASNAIDLKRAEMNLAEAVIADSTAKLDLDQGYFALKKNLNLSEDESFTLSSPLRLADPSQHLTLENLQKVAKSQAGYAERLSRLRLQQAETTRDTNRYEYLPSFELNASKSFEDSSQPSYGATITWNLLSQRSTSLTGEELSARAEQSSLLLTSTIRKHQIQIQQQMIEILKLRDRLAAVGKIAQLSEAVLATSRQRASTGLVSMQNLSSDLSNYIKDQDRETDTKSQLVKAVIDFCHLLGRPDRFASFLSP